MKNLIKKMLVLLLLMINIYGQELTQYVDPFIGTGGHGHTYPGATVPFGMVQLSPDTRVGNWDACGGYHFSDSTIIGFSHQHLSGVGVLDYGDILFMPTIGKIQLQKGNENKTIKGYRSKFHHSSEVAETGYYSVVLEDYSIKAELTATTRAGFHRYTYPDRKEENLIIDLTHQLEPGERIIKLEFEIIDENTVQGLRRSSGWAADQIVYFYAKFSKSIIESGISIDGNLSTNKTGLVSGDNIKAYLKFNNNADEPLLVKVGISAVDYDGAKNNLTTEIPGWDFDTIRKGARELWNKQLSKILINDKSEDKKKIFYTALYHSSLVPNVYFDVDRRYRGNDRKIHECKDFDNYTVYSLWDTFRSTHPLFVLIEPKIASNIIKSMLAKYEESGLLPKWELAGNETGTMIGYHAVSAITDAYIKGIINLDSEKILEAMLHSANNNSDEMKLYRKYGYVPSDKKIESVSKTLEYAYDDWCIYIFAKSTGNKEIAKKFEKRAKNYINLFDGKTGFFRGRKTNGNWEHPFDPFEISRDYTEANAWQYSCFVPHDVNGMINLQGGKEKFSEHLDNLFTTEMDLSGRDIPDVTGLIGQYAHGNEPSHHVAYLYNFVDQQWKTQQRIHQILNEMYNTTSDGIIGNEDCGQMSSWYVFSSMGFYPFCPGTDEYQIGSPIFESITINLENGKKVNIRNKNLSDKNYYVQSVVLNGKKVSASFIRQMDISDGAQIEFIMEDKPNEKWGIVKKQMPYSLTNVITTSIPFINNNVGYFVDSVKIDFGCRTNNVSIRYTLYGDDPNEESTLFIKPFTIKSSSVIKARAYKEDYFPGPIMKVNATKAEFLDAVKVDKISEGINYKYFEGKFRSAYELQTAEVIKTGTLNNFNLDEAEKEDHFGFIFEGYIDIPLDDIYTFFCKSDDGSVLLINGKEIVNNDGSHAAISTSSQVALRKGLHPFTLLYFEDYEGNSIDVYWESNKIEKEKLPNNVLYK